MYAHFCSILQIYLCFVLLLYCSTPDMLLNMEQTKNTSFSPPNTTYYLQREQAQKYTKLEWGLSTQCFAVVVSLSFLG